MAGKRKLWMVRYSNGARVIARPESRVTAYRYVTNARNQYLDIPREYDRYVEVLVDERDGAGFRVHDLIDLAKPEER